MRFVTLVTGTAIYRARPLYKYPICTMPAVHVVAAFVTTTRCFTDLTFVKNSIIRTPADFAAVACEIRTMLWERDTVAFQFMKRKFYLLVILNDFFMNLLIITFFLSL